MTGLGLLVAVLLLTVVPLGTRLLRGAPPLAWWYATGALAASSLTTDGPLLALPFATLTSFTAVRVALRREPWVRWVAASTAAGSLAVAGGALVVDRTGVELWGFDHARWRLTVLHFCVAGFACALLAGLTHVATGRGTAVVLLLPVGTATVATGHFLGDDVELAGAVVLTTALLLLAAVVVRRLAGPPQLVLVSALTPVATMLLALSWAVGEAFDLPHLSLGATAATHGVANALGVGLCGVLGWTSFTKERL